MTSRSEVGAAVRSVGLLLALLVAPARAFAAEGSGEAPEPAGKKEPAGEGGEAEEFEPHIVLGVGGADSVELSGGSNHVGGNAFVEWNAVPKWLELELGASVLTADSGVSIPIELLFKKPFRLAPGIEFMPGIGPEVVHVTGPSGGTYFGGTIGLDFMFWPTQRVGLWVEPSYDFVVHDGVSHALGGTGGVIFGL
jgi:hypothetical protein